MDNRSPDDECPPKEVTAVISRKIKTGYEKDYDDWGSALCDVREKGSRLSWNDNNRAWRQ